MKNKKSTSFYVAISAVFCVIYIVCAAHPLGTEYQFVPDWRIDVSSPRVEARRDGEALLCFKLGQTAGYFTEDGRVTNFVTFPFRAAVSPSYYAPYGSGGVSVPFFYPDGSQAGEIRESGFPLIDGDRIFVFLPGGSSFAMCGGDGARVWSYEGVVPVTAFGSSAAGCAAGFADGTVRVFAPDGTVVRNFTPGGSDYPVILGVAISDSGDYIATVSGQKPQRFVLAKKDGAQLKIIFHEFIEEGSARQELVRFCDGGETVFYNTKNSLGIVSTRTGRSAHIRLSGHVIDIQQSDGCAFILAKDGTTYTVYAVEKFATLLGSFSFSAETAFITAKDGSLYVGKDSAISRITVSRN